MAGMTFFRPIAAVLSTPQRSLVGIVSMITRFGLLMWVEY
jgi:hypothetical protein